MAVIGLDVGTTCCKCGLYTDEGKLVHIKSAEYEIIRDGGGQYINTKALWQNVKKIISEAGKGYEVKGIAVSSLGEAFVPVDNNFNILGNAMLYTDTRGSIEAKQLLSKFSKDKIFTSTGHVPHYMYSLPKMMWMKNNAKDIYDKADYLMLIGDFVNFMLSGINAIDFSLASRTMAFDIHNKKWFKKILDIAEIDINKLSKPFISGTVIGEIRKEIAEELNISKSCKVITGAHDQICSALGAGVVSKGLSIDGTGTVECITPVFDKPSDNLEMADCGYPCVPYAIDGLYVTYMLNFTCGALLKWFKDKIVFGHNELLKQKNQAFYYFYNSKMPEKPTDLLVLPYFAGAATPFMDSQAKGAILNMTLSTNSFDIYRALMESTAFEMRLNFEKVKEFGININELTVTGGGAKSEKWLQIKADILQVPVYPLETTEAGINGAAMMALKGLNLFKDYNEAVKVMVKRKSPVFPKAENVCFYDNQYEKYKKIYKNIKEIM